DQGHIVGASWGIDSNHEYLFINRNGHTDNLGDLHWTSVVGVGNGDMITGHRIFAGSIQPTAFRLDASVAALNFQPLGHSSRPGFDGSIGTGINAGGIVVGISIASAGGYVAFVDYPPSSPEQGFYDLAD